jgi:hypothetical protein
MDRTFEIYDTDTKNLIRSFPSEAAALAMVRRTIERNSSKAVASWAMGADDPDAPLYVGNELIERAMGAAKSA